MSSRIIRFESDDVWQRDGNGYGLWRRWEQVGQRRKRWKSDVRKSSRTLSAPVDSATVVCKEAFAATIWEITIEIFFTEV